MEAGWRMGATWRMESRWHMGAERRKRARWSMGAEWRTPARWYMGARQLMGAEGRTGAARPRGEARCWAVVRQRTLARPSRLTSLSNRQEMWDRSKSAPNGPDARWRTTRARSKGICRAEPQNRLAAPFQG
jgi:hypothetical protein